jgi:hypothetical protein
MSVPNKIKPNKRKELGSTNNSIQKQSTTHKKKAKIKSSNNNNSNNNNDNNNNNSNQNYLAICDGFELEQNSEQDNVVDYDAEGEWEENKVKSLALDQIIFKQWLPERTELNLKLISETKTVLPIQASYNKKKQKYELSDGNHRCCAAKILGYTHIPAVLAYANKTQPYPDKVMEKWRMVESVSELVKLDEESCFLT